MSRKKDLVEELHKPARRNYPRRRVDVRGLDETWQADLVEMQPYARENKGYRYLLTCIDIFSKYAWTVAVKSKTGKDIASAMQIILAKGRVPKHLHTDRGKEFYNKDFDAIMKKYKIHLYSTYSNLKASICERFNRTLKNIMWKHFSIQGNYKWINILPKLTIEYNERKHRTIGMKPVQVTHENERDILNTKFAQKVGSVSQKFKIGDKVRVSKAKHLFEKSYTLNWSTEVFTVCRVAPTDPVTYHLQDYLDHPISGCFYEEELLLAKHADVYLVEKIVKRQANKVYVKWLGFDSTHNSWIDKNDAV
uniref:Integrase catalytic domain-containing protein n=1 Tax=Trichogramma kaykai TaxID=54128 RepID=A0ABD2XQD3_9HYME